MTADEFRQWRTRLGLSKAGAAETLGLSRNMPRRYETGVAPIPVYIALACSAVALNVAPYGEQQ